MKKIIFNADDFGPSQFINDGICEGIEKEVINSVSAFVTFGQENLDNIKKLKAKFGDRVKIGLHFTLTAGAPAHQPREAVSSIYEKATAAFEDRFWLFSSMNLKAVDLAHVEMELNAQLDALEDQLDGEPINHLNSHQGLLTFYRPYWEICKRVAVQRNIPLRNPVSFEYTHPYLSDRMLGLPITRLGGKAGIQSVFKGNLKTALKLKKGANKKRLKRKAQEAIGWGISMPSNYVISYFGQASEEIIELVLSEIKDGETVEFLLHPGRGNYENDNDWGVNPKSLMGRENELDVLLNCGLADLLTRHEVEMTDYRNL